VTLRGALALSLCAALAMPVAAQDVIVATPMATSSATRTLVPAGTVIELVTTNAISSKKSAKGDLLHLKVAAPVMIDGVIAIATDAVVVAQLTRADPRGAFGKSGKLDIQLLYAELPGGSLRVSGALEARGKGDAGDGVATAAAFLFMPFIATGRSAEIPAGSEVAGRLDRDLWIDRR
jgi:hypothetical protein